jgi:hypothetical protein
MTIKTDPRNDDQPQRLGGYYYSPLTENGEYQKRLKQDFSYAAEAVVKAYQIATHHETDWSGLAGYVAGQVGGEIGFYIDNFSTIQRNLETLANQLNDPKMWMDSGLGDSN